MSELWEWIWDMQGSDWMLPNCEYRKLKSIKKSEWKSPEDTPYGLLKDGETLCAVVYDGTFDTYITYWACKQKAEGE